MHDTEIESVEFFLTTNVYQFQISLISLEKNRELKII